MRTWSGYGRCPYTYHEMRHCSSALVFTAEHLEYAALVVQPQCWFVPLICPPLVHLRRDAAVKTTSSTASFC